MPALLSLETLIHIEAALSLSTALSGYMPAPQQILFGGVDDFIE
jgi:hypothetical protein